MKFSIIIPCKSLNGYVEESISYSLKQDYTDFEILLLPDAKIKKKFPKTRIIPTGPVHPSIKRNIAAEKAKGEILAFIDSDAYPQSQWLSNSLKYFKDPDLGIIGGPNLTPQSDTALQKASGDILSSIFTGSSSTRYKINTPREVDELPSCNLFIRNSLFKKFKFDSKYLTAEDSKLCFQVKKEKKKIMYVPDLIVYHHRRPLFFPHLKQMFIYGRDIAWLIKESFSFSKLYYSILSIFVIYLIAGIILSFLNTAIKFFYLFSVLSYLTIMLIYSILFFNRSFLVFTGLILTHLSYGLGFIYGVLKKNKK